MTERALVGTCRATLSFVEECEPEFIQTRAFRACDAEIVGVAADEKLVNVSILPISHGFLKTDSLESLFIYESGHDFVPGPVAGAATVKRSQQTVDVLVVFVVSRWRSDADLAFKALLHKHAKMLG